ncbi:Beta-barrel assembly-enhancing protease [Paraburkholderia hiiakae]|uniref:Beta-barrel assembly-enhancing protease n=2 Tax=Paraburkholderia hiiakae TaxID=1081782 RepID=A0ABM8NXQ0_9BURK|nr:M48 family metallopeptidase [Paraburkholderia hiiakae]CAD6548486.1 Beta-barrel assembly-enhancing protease [Paraburkholderia hiiakae]
MSVHETAVQSQRARQRRGKRARALAMVLAAAWPALSAWSASAADNPAATSAPAAVPGNPATPPAVSAASASIGAINPTNSANGAANSGASTNATPDNVAPGAPNTGRVVRFGNAAVYRNLIPSPMLEAQATAEFNEIVRGAAHSNRLYAESDPHVQRVRAFVDRLAPYALKWSDRVKNWKWEVAVIRSNDIRMYALPGGKIVVYGGLLDRVKLNDNEFGMLLGHEIAHAVREHVRERLGEQQAAQIESGSVPQLFGLADLGVFPLGIGSQLVEMHYGRADETEADVIGSDIASRAGFDPRAALTLWDKLAVATRADRDQGFIYVHPYTPARRADIAKRLADMMPLYAKAIGKPLAELPDYEGIPAVQKRKVVSAP